MQEDFDEEENPDGFTLVGSVPEAPPAVTGELNPPKHPTARSMLSGPGSATLKHQVSGYL